MAVLALSTSTPRASVALLEDGRALAEVARDDQRSHAEHLIALVDSALAEAGRARADVRLVACDVGPGSFTGVRIAVATAKGIALGLGVPIEGVTSLSAMAESARASAPPGALVAAAIDAKKDELYLAVYDGDVELSPPEHVASALAAERVERLAAGRPFVLIVDAPAFAGLSSRAERALVAPPSAAWIGRIAARRGARAQDHDVAPLYVRAPDAIPSAR